MRFGEKKVGSVIVQDISGLRKALKAYETGQPFAVLFRHFSFRSIKHFLSIYLLYSDCNFFSSEKICVLRKSVFISSPHFESSVIIEILSFEKSGFFMHVSVMSGFM
jgi:hypothetical protein